MLKHTTCFVFTAILLLTSALPVTAEWSTDLYVGGAFSNKTDQTQTSSLGFTATAHNLKIDNSITGGLRVGYWFEGIDWLGMGLDVFYFRAKAGNQTAQVSISGFGSVPVTGEFFSIPVVGIGFDVLRLRIPLLVSEAFPKGQLQPYVTAGPALFVTWADAPSTFQPPNQSKTDTALGLKVGGGLTFMVSRSVGLFGEYRFTHFTTEMTFQDTTPPPSTETFKTTLDTHHLVGGLSFRF